MSGMRRALSLKQWATAPLPAHGADHFRVLLLAGAALSGGFAGYDLWRGDLAKGLGEVGLFVLYSGLRFWLRGRVLTRGIVYSCLGVGVGFMLAEIGRNDMVALWLPVTVITAFGFLGQREGSIWAVVVWLIAAAQLLFDAMRPAPLYDPEVAINILLVSLLVAFMAIVAHGWIERGRTALMAEAARVQRREDARRVAGGIAHLINNEMQAVVGHAELARMEPDDARRLQDLDQVIDMARKASRHANQLVAYAHDAERGGKAFDVAETLGCVFRRWREGLPDGVLAHLECHAGARLRCLGDAALLGEALAGILENAREAIERRHGSAGGRIRIRLVERQREQMPPALPSGDFFCIEIEDNGDGVPKNMRERVFEPFVTTGFLGRGLGLASAQGIVRSHGGHIEVADSGMKEGGALFRVWLPALSPASA